jgi:hypothetical protein
MKNSRIFFMLTIFVLQMNAKSLEPYLTGTLTDEKGRTFYHKLAQNCDCNHELALRVLVAVRDLEIRGINTEDRKEVSILQVDNEGISPLAMARARFEKTGHPDCKELIANFEAEEKKELAALEKKMLSENQKAEILDAQ